MDGDLVMATKGEARIPAAALTRFGANFQGEIITPVHPVYQARYGWRSEDYPQAEAIGQQTVSLPFSARLADGDVEDVIEAVRATLGGGR